MLSISATVTAIDSAYEPDPYGEIDIIGTDVNGREIDLLIVNTGDGAYVYPGASFLPYGGIYYNPLLTSIQEGLLRR